MIRNPLAPLESKLLSYIKKDDLGSFEKLVDSVFNLDYKFSRYALFHEEYLRFSPSLLAIAAFYNAVHIFRYLLIKGANIDKQDLQKHSIANFAVHGGNFEILHLLDEYKASFDGTLFTAAEVGKEEVFKWIYYYKCEDIHERKRDGSTLIHVASKSGNSNLMHFLFDKLVSDLSVSELLALLEDLKKNNHYDFSDSYDSSDDDSTSSEEDDYKGSEANQIDSDNDQDTSENEHDESDKNDNDNNSSDSNQYDGDKNDSDQDESDENDSDQGASDNEHDANDNNDNDQEANEQRSDEQIINDNENERFTDNNCSENEAIDKEEENGTINEDHEKGSSKSHNQETMDSDNET